MLNTHKIVQNELEMKYNKWKRLNSLVSTRNKNKLTIIIISLKLICQAIWITFLQKVNKTIKKINRNKYELTYVIEGKIYKMIVTVSRGPSPVLQIINDKNDDVTSQIVPYLGPNYNWHNTKFTPESFGFETLTFELSDGTEYTTPSKTNIKSLV